MNKLVTVLNFRPEFPWISGLSQRIVRDINTSVPVDTSLDQRTVMIYSAAWQLLEERVDDGWSGGTFTLCARLSGESTHARSIATLARRNPTIAALAAQLDCDTWFTNARAGRCRAGHAATSILHVKNSNLHHFAMFCNVLANFRKLDRFAPVFTGFCAIWINSLSIRKRFAKHFSAPSAMKTPRRSAKTPMPLTTAPVARAHSAALRFAQNQPRAQRMRTPRGAHRETPVQPERG